MYIVSFFKNKGVLASIVVLILAGGAFTLYFLFIQALNSGDLFYNIEEHTYTLSRIFTPVANVVYPLFALSRAMLGTPTFNLAIGLSVFINLVIFFVSIAALLTLSMLITNLAYKKSAASFLENKKATTKSSDKFVAGSASGAFIKKEIKDIIRQPAFAFNILLPIIIAPIIIVVMVFSTSAVTNDIAENISPQLEAQIMWFTSFLFLLMFAINFNTGAMSSITREGKAFHISKLIPVPYKVQIRAKLIVNLSISLIACLFSLAAISILQFDIINLAFALVVSAVMAYGFTCFAMSNDLRKPKLDWVTPNQAFKSNLTSLISMLVGVGYSLILIVIAFVPIALVDTLLHAQLIAWFAMLLPTLILSIFTHILLFKNVDKFYDRIGEN